MKIDCTKFGSIAIDGNTYAHDVLIRLSGEARRKKELSGKYCGDSHKEAEFICEKGCDILLLGARQDGKLTLSPGAAEFFGRRDCRVILPSTEAVRACNPTRRKAGIIGLFRVAC
jgi:hypothetical protein